MPEPFGKRNRPIVEKLPRAKPRKRNRPKPRRGNSKLYLYVVGIALVLAFGGYAFAT